MLRNRAGGAAYHGPMSDPALRLLTEEEYLSTEELSPVRREYVDGFVYAQAGASASRRWSATHTAAGTVKLFWQEG